MTPEQRRKVLAEIERERLVALVYGEVVSDEDCADLARIAEAAGVGFEQILPASGEPHFEAPVNPQATYDPQVTVYAEDASSLVTEIPESRPAPEPEGGEEAEEIPGEKAAEGPGREAFVALKTRFFADVAAVTGLDTAAVAALVGSWATAADMAAGLRRIIADQLGASGSRVALAA